MRTHTGSKVQRSFEAIYVYILGFSSLYLLSIDPYSQRTSSTKAPGRLFQTYKPTFRSMNSLTHS